MSGKNIPIYHHNPDDRRLLPERLMEDIGCELDSVDLPYSARRYSACDFLKAVYGSKVARNYQRMEFVYASDLYLLVQTMPYKSALIQAVKTYLADASAIPHLSELNGIDIKQFGKLGRPTSWIDERVWGIVQRNRFTSALECAVIDLLPRIFLHATEEVYVGLWERTTAMLRGDLKIAEKQNVRDYMGEYALIYIRLTEKTCAERLNDADEVTYSQAIELVQVVAGLFHQQASETSRMLGIDLVTEKPLIMG